MNNYSNAQEGNSLFVTRSASADSADRLSLWIGESVICTCAHHQIDHSRNDEPGHGHCSIRYDNNKHQRFIVGRSQAVY